MQGGANSRHVILALIGLCLAWLSPFESSAATDRQALVIGNNAYTGLEPLENARHDAAAIADNLRKVGFDVTTVLDGDLDQMTRKVVEFSSRLDKDTVSLFYYAGHGVQHDGVNFLIPSDYSLGDPSLLSVDSLALDEVVTRVAAADNRLAIYILDACRNNPFVDARGNNGGLAPIDAPYGSFVAFATAPGHIAYDGLSGSRHGAFTEAFLNHVTRPDLRLEDVFKLVRRDVVAATDEQQVPWTSSSLVGDFYFTGDGSGSASKLTKDLEQEPPISPPPDEYLHWATIKDSDVVDDYDAFMSAYPDGDLYELAVMRRERLQQESVRPNGHDPAALAEEAGSKRNRTAVCDYCPEIVEIGPGVFQMGSKGSNGQVEADEQPIREVVVRQSFEISRFEITQSEFDQFVRDTEYMPETKCGHPSQEMGDGAWTFIDALSWWRERDPEHPATCVSWLDAVSYTRWLSEVTGDNYRLPTEAEWEFAARGGQQMERFWGNAPEEACRYANGYDDIGAARFPSAKTPHRCSDGYAAVAPVGMFEANGFALHDMLGNAAEWVLDCRTDSYNGAPYHADVINQSGRCAYRTLRGGSWHADEQVMRSAYRDWTTPITRGSMVGFRVVRDLYGR